MTEEDIRTIERKYFSGIELELAEYKDLYNKGLELIQTEPRPKQLLLDILDEYQKRLDDLPPVDLSETGLKNLPNGVKERVKSLVLFGTQAVLIKENAALLEELRRVNENYRNLLSLVSHEFKNTLTSINGYTQLIEKRIHSSKYDSLPELNENINRLSANLFGLVETLFSMLLIEEGELRLNRKFFDIVEDSLKPVLLELRMRLTKAGMQVEVEAGHEKNIVLGDEKLLQLVFRNLILNAIQYGKKGTNIKIKIDRKENHIDIIVVNSGNGLEKEQLNRIFEKFSRFHSTNNRTNIGIGLFAVKSIIELHGGTIEAESNMDEGMRFTIRLPFTNNNEAVE